MGFFQKIAQGIKKTKDSISKKLFYAFAAYRGNPKYRNPFWFKFLFQLLQRILTVF